MMPSGSASDRTTTTTKQGGVSQCYSAKGNGAKYTVNNRTFVIPAVLKTPGMAREFSGELAKSRICPKDSQFLSRTALGVSPLATAKQGGVSPLATAPSPYSPAAMP